MSLDIRVLTLVPGFYNSVLKDGVFSRAVSAGVIGFSVLDLRDYSDREDRRVDDRPFGGGPGMVIRADVTATAIADMRRTHSKVVFVSPVGQVFDRGIALQLSKETDLIFVAGRYEGFDERVVAKEADLQLSLGDFVLTGGDPAVVAMVDAISRFVPGVLGNSLSANSESFEDGLLEEPVYTRPEVFGELAVPAVLLSGDHAKIAHYRRRERLRSTAKRRPDLLVAAWEQLTEPERSFVKKLWQSK